MPSSKPLHRIADIVDNIESIQSYVVGLDRQGFVNNSLVADAVERCLSRISEAAVKLGDEASELVPGEPWSEIRGIGNHIRHGYHYIGRDRIWDVVETNLPSLLAGCAALLEREKFSR